MQRIISFLLLGLCLAYFTTTELLATPTTQASGISFLQVKSDQFRVTVTKGNGNSRIVVVQAGNSISGTPNGVYANVNGDFSSASAMDAGAGGAAKVVYYGTGSNVFVKNVAPGTEYTVKVYEYDDNDSTYITSDGVSGNPANVSTAPDMPGQVKSVSQADVKETSFTFKWTVPDNGSYDGFNIRLATNSQFTDFVAGYDPEDVGNVTTFEPTGLQSNTTYYYQVQTYKGALQSNWKNGPTSVTTKPAKPTLASNSASVCYGDTYILSPTGPAPGNGTTEHKFKAYLTEDGNTALVNTALTSINITPSSPTATDYWIATVSNKTGYESGRVKFTLTANPAAPAADAGNDDELCDVIPYNFTLTGNNPDPDNDNNAVGTWTLISGPQAIVDLDIAEYNSVVELPAQGVYKLEWKIDNGTCSPTYDTVEVSLYNAPTAASIAVKNYDVCVNTTTMDANTPLVGTGSWSYVDTENNGGEITFSNNSNPSATATASQPGIYKLYWTISNGTCSTSSDSTIVIFDIEPTTATVDNANVDLCGEVEFELEGNSPVIGTGTWELASSQGVTYTASFDDATLPNATVTVSRPGTYSFVWRIASPYGVCDTSDATVTVVFSEKPTVAAAALREAISCGDLSVELGATQLQYGEGTWTVIDAVAGSTYEFGGTENFEDAFFLTDKYGEYTLRWTVVDPNNHCATTYDDITFILSEKASDAEAGFDRSVCGLSATLDATEPIVGTGTWTLVSGDGELNDISDANAYNAVVTVSDYGTYSFEWKVASECSSSTSYVHITFVNDLNGWSAGSDAGTCDPNTAVTLAGDNPSSYGVSVTAEWTKVSGPGIVSFVNGTTKDDYNAEIEFTSPGTYVMRWTGYNGNNCSSSDDVTIIVNAGQANVVFDALPNSGNFCISDNTEYDLEATPAGGTFSGEGVNGTKFNPSDATTAGTYTLTYTYDDLGCITVKTQTVVIYAAPTLTWATSYNDMCAADNAFDLTGVGEATPTGGTYSGTGVSGNQFDPTGLSGTYTITYTYDDNNGCSASITNTITVYAEPVITWATSYDPVCVDGASITLNASASNASSTYYDGPGISGNVFSPASAGVGTHTITYNAYNAGACTVFVSKTIVVQAKPTLTWATNYLTQCIDGSILEIDGDATPVGGTYSGTGIFQDINDNNKWKFDPAQAQEGTVLTWTYTYDDGVCDNSITKEVVVGTKPVIVSAGNYGPVCVTENPFDLNNANPAGGTYTGVGVSGNQFDPADAGVGVHTLTYTYTLLGGCTSSEVLTIEVNAQPEVVWNSSYGPYCVSEAIVTFDAEDENLGDIGTYSSASQGFVNGNQFDPSAAGPGTHTVTYTVTVGNCTDAVSKTIVVNALPNVIAGSYDAICTTNFVVLDKESPAGGTYTGDGVKYSESMNAYIFTATLVNYQPGTYTVTYTYEDGNGCENSVDFDIVVNEQPVVTWNEPTTDFCVSDNTPIQLSASTTVGTGAYSGHGIDVQNGTFNPATAGVGTHTITYLATNLNCTKYETKVFTVYEQPVISWSENVTSFCSNDNTDYQLSASTTVGTGAYSGEVSLTGVFNPSTAGAGVHTITYTATNGVCEVSETKTFTVYEQPVVTWNASYGPYCVTAGAVALDDASTTAGTGVYSGAGVSGNGQDGYVFTPSSVGAGTYTITYTATNEICSDAVSKTIVVDETPVISWSENVTSFCSNDNTDYQLSASTTVGTGAYSGEVSLTGVFNPSTAGAGVHTITYTATNGTCEVSETKTFTVYEQPVVTWNASYGPYCVTAGAVTLDDASTTAGTGVYSGAGVSGNGQDGYVFTPSSVGAGTYTITYTATNEICSDAVSKTIVVDETPVISWSENVTSFCSNDNTDYQLSASTTVGTGAYSGEVSLSGVFNPSTAGAGVHTITYTATNGACEVSETKTFTVYEQPVITWNASYGPYCETAGAVALDDASTTAGTGVYSGAGVSGNGQDGYVFTPSSVGAGTYTITYTATNEICSDAVSKTIVVDETPSISWVELNTSFCVDDNTDYSLSATTTVGTGAYSGAGIDVQNSTFKASDAGAGTHTITYTATNGACTTVETMVFVVNPLPTVNAGTYDAICVNSNPLTLTNGTPANGYYVDDQYVSNNVFTPTSAGIYTLTYVFTDGNGCTNSATTTIQVDAAIYADAGNDDDAVSGDLDYVLNGNNPNPGTGVWAVVDSPVGSTVLFDSESAYNSGISVSDFGEYTFSWTVTNGACEDVDYVTITFADDNFATYLAFVNPPTYTNSGDTLTVTVASFNSSDVQTSPASTVNFTLNIVSGDGTIVLSGTGSITPSETSTTVSVAVSANDPDTGAELVWQPEDDAANLTSQSSTLYVRATAPIDQANNLLFISWSTTDVSMEWTPAEDADGTMIIAQKNTTYVAYADSKVSGSYDSEDNYGVAANKIATNVYATYVGDGSFARITNLARGSRHAFKVIAYKGEGNLRSYNHTNNVNDNNKGGSTLKDMFGNDLPLVGDNILSASHITPNPARDYVMLTIDLAQTADLRIAFYSADGKQVMLPVNSSNYNEGRHSFNIPIKGLAAGVYSVVISAGNEVIMDNVVVMP